MRPHIVTRQLVDSDHKTEFWTGGGWSFDNRAALRFSSDEALLLIACLIRDRAYSYIVSPAS